MAVAYHAAGVYLVVSQALELTETSGIRSTGNTGFIDFDWVEIQPLKQKQINLILI
jgi:hypothetical protein